MVDSAFENGKGAVSPLPQPPLFFLNVVHEIVASHMEVEYPISKNPGAKTAAGKKPANQFEASRHFLFFFSSGWEAKGKTGGLM